MLRRMRRVSPINSCHTLLVSDDGDTISEANNTSFTSNTTTFTFHFIFHCLRRMCKVSLVSVRPCHIKLVSVVLFTSYFRLEQGQAHLSSSLRPINSINIESAASTLFRLGRDSVTQWLAAGLTRNAGSVCFPWVIPTGYDFIRQPQKHSRDLVTFWP